MTAAAPFYILINGSPMHATGQPPYQFATYEEAAAMVDICYGLGAIDKFLTINHPPPIMSHQFLATEDLPTASVDELTKDINEAEKLLAVHPDHFTSYEAAQEDEAYRRDVQGHLERVQWTLSQR